MSHFFVKIVFFLCGFASNSRQMIYEAKPPVRWLYFMAVLFKVEESNLSSRFSLYLLTVQISNTFIISWRWMKTCFIYQILYFTAVQFKVGESHLHSRSSLWTQLNRSTPVFKDPDSLEMLNYWWKWAREALEYTCGSFNGFKRYNVIFVSKFIVLYF